MTGVGATPRPPEARLALAAEAALDDVREVWFQVDGALAPHAARIVERASLAPGAAVDGPAIVVQGDTTTVVPPGFRASADDAGNLVIPIGER